MIKLKCFKLFKNLRSFNKIINLTERKESSSSKTKSASKMLSSEAGNNMIDTKKCFKFEIWNVLNLKFEIFY